MNEEFKKFLCEKAGVEYSEKPQIIHTTGNADEANDFLNIAIPIKAMWAINRNNVEKKLHPRIQIDAHGVAILQGTIKHYDFQDHSNSEQEALTAALEYIWLTTIKNTDKGGE